MAQEKFLNPPMEDIIEQWKFYFSLLQPQAGHRVVDVGCNNGDAERLLVQEYPAIAKVIGVELAKRRFDEAVTLWDKNGRPGQIGFQHADGQHLPFPADHFDRAMCVETLEWIDNSTVALNEIFRVLKPGGAAAIVHSDYDTQVFSASDKGLCRRIVNAFSDSGPNGQMGRELYRRCANVGFRQVQPFVYALVNCEWRTDRYAYRIAHMMCEWLTSLNLIKQDELKQWIVDLETQASAGTFFYTINRYVCLCAK